jgi:hypothetical protein
MEISAYLDRTSTANTGLLNFSILRRLEKETSLFVDEAILDFAQYTALIREEPKKIEQVL